MTTKLVPNFLIVLNNDTLICDGCYEVNKLSETAIESDFGTFPMGRTARGECATCGAMSVWAQTLPDAR